MATITFTLQDNGPSVKVTTAPAMESLLRKIASHGPRSLTPAEGYAVFLSNRLREESARAAGNIIVPVPRVGRR